MQQLSDGLLLGPLTRDTHNVQDIFRFMLTFVRRRRAARKIPLSDALIQYFVEWRRALVAWFSWTVDKLALACCLDNADSQDQAPPAIQYKSPLKRKYTVVSVHAKWSTLVEARRVRANAETVLALGRNASHLGCATKVATVWMRKEQHIYLDRCGFALSGAGAHHPS